MNSMFIRGEGGGIHEVPVPLPEGFQSRLDKGYIVRVNEDGSVFTGVEEQRKPYGNEPKSVWVGWAVKESARRGDPITPDDAEALTKSDLIELYGM